MKRGDHKIIAYPFVVDGYTEINVDVVNPDGTLDSLALVQLKDDTADVLVWGDPNDEDYTARISKELSKE